MMAYTSFPPALIVKAARQLVAALFHLGVILGRDID